MYIGKKQQLIKEILDANLLSLIHQPLNTIMKLHGAKNINLNQQDIQQNFCESVWNAVSREQK